MQKKIAILIALLINISVFPQQLCDVELSRKSKKEYEQAYKLYESNMHTSSSEIARKLIQREPEAPEPYFLMGLIAAQKENLKAMDKYFSKVLELCPDFVDARVHYYMGIVNYSYERYERAAMNFDMFLSEIEIQPELYNDIDVDQAEVYAYWSRKLNEAYLNPVPFDPKSISGVSSSAAEYLAYQTVDGSRMYYIREVVKNEDNSSFYKQELETKTPKLLESKRGKDGKFNKGRSLDPPFNTGKNEKYITLTADNKLLYFASTAKTNGEYSNSDIYYTTYKNGYWSEPQNAGNMVNTATSWESQPSITPDGGMLYFASNRFGGFGGSDIWRVKRLPNGDWGRAENLGPSVNTEGDECSPFIHPDGVSLYFASNGWEGLGGYDMYYTRIDNDKKNRKPTNLGYPINTGDDEMCFGVTTTGDKAYFSSSKHSGLGNSDICEFDLYPSIRPNKVTLIKGIVEDENNNPIGGELELFVSGNQAKTFYKIDDHDGTFTAILDSDKDYILIAKRKGYAFSSMLFTKKGNNTSDSALHFQILPIEEGESYNINDITFENNASNLTPSTTMVIDAFIEFLIENPTVHVSIEGHTDNVGDAEENRILSERRAKSVYDYLIEKRIRPDRLEYRGMGAEKPTASNDTEEGRAKNRRTVFVITRK
jgi:outer membrane protein OmpA-like peptidoglycan-associated protein/tetratricopeptide (TPR) repeat protein